jgi:dihydrodipicolinate synthase/N-acetylneuraminate lyase
LKYSGVVVPMVTPFTPAGDVDEPAVGRIVEHLVSNKIGGIFPLGTTGESASIAPDQKRRVVEATVRANKDRAKVYAGIAGNCFRESVDAAVAYKALGVDCVVAHMPSYYPLNDDEIEAYFLKLADRVPLPLILYNIPVTTHHHIALDVVDRLRKHPNIVAIKDSANDPARLVELLRRTGGRGGWPVLVGTSLHMTLGFKHGAVGIVPSGGHLVPDLYQAMYESAMRDDWAEVERLQRETDQACQQYLKGRTIGQGLAALKALLEKRGICGRTMLPPLLDCKDEL